MKILDCTLRDGGFVNNWEWPDGFVEDYLEKIKPCVDWVELGYLDKLDGVELDGKTAVIYDYGKKIKPDDIPRWSVYTSKPLVRIAARPENIIGALEDCIEVRSKGYLVSLNIMCASDPRFQTIDIRGLVKSFKGKVDYVYFADSCGAMKACEVRGLVLAIKEAEIKTGFHPHDNLGRAYANYLAAKDTGAYMIDTTIQGIGRGAGNLALETVVPNVNVIEFIERWDLRKRYTWGNTFLNRLTGLYNCHQNYANDAPEEGLVEYFDSLSGKTKYENSRNHTS